MSSRPRGPESDGFRSVPVPEPVTAGDEVARWARTMSAEPETARPGGAGLADELTATVPAPGPAVVVHGDFRLGNLPSRT